MKTSLCLALLAATAAHAQTVVDFNTPTSCPSYCTGFTTDDPSVKVDYVNASSPMISTGQAVISVDGVTYRGDTRYVAIGAAGTHTLYQADGILYADDGNSIAVGFVDEYWTTGVMSGRHAGRLTPHTVVQGGSVTLP